jgi:predicted oxidoreductase
MEPEEVAAAFDALHGAGKVRYFGVSNQNPGQMALLQKSITHKLIVNQMQLSLAHTGMIDYGFNVNTNGNAACSRDGGILDYCRLNDVTIQAWSPFVRDFPDGIFIDDPDFRGLNEIMAEIAEKYSVTKDAIAVAWILRHPAKIQTVIGSMNPQRIANIAKAASFTLTHHEWYALYMSAGNSLP